MAELITGDAAELQKAQTELHKAKSWILQHERLLALVLILAAGLWTGNKVINWRASADKTAAAIAVEKLNEQKASNDKLAQQNAVTVAQYQQLVRDAGAANAALAKAVSARNTALADQQKKNLTMPPSDLIIQWSNLIGTEGVSQHEGSSDFTVADAAARATVNELEAGVVAQANYVSQQTITENTKTELVKANDVIGGLNTQVGGLQAQIVGEEKTCQQRIDSVKADDRKGKLKWFKAGVVVGFIGGLITGHHVPAI